MRFRSSHRGENTCHSPEWCGPQILNHSGPRHSAFNLPPARWVSLANALSPKRSAILTSTQVHSHSHSPHAPNPHNPRTTKIFAGVFGQASAKARARTRIAGNNANQTRRHLREPESTTTPRTLHGVPAGRTTPSTVTGAVGQNLSTTNATSSTTARKVACGHRLKTLPSLCKRIFSGSPNARPYL